MQQVESPVQLTERWATIDVWLETRRAMRDLDSAESEKLFLPVTAGQYILTGRDWSEQTGHNDIETRQARSAWFFGLVSRSKGIYLLIYPAPHNYAHYPMSKKKKLAELLSLEEVTIPGYFVSIGHVYLQHARWGWRDFHSLQYHAERILSSKVFKDAVEFAYGASLSMVKKPGTGSEKEGPEQGIGGTSRSHKIDGPKKNDKSNEEDSKNEGSTEGSRYPSEALEWKRTAANIATELGHSKFSQFVWVRGVEPSRTRLLYDY